MVASFLLLLAVAAIGTAVLKPAWYLRAVYQLKYEDIIAKHAENYDLPPALVAAVIRQESNFDHTARSDAGAVGLMQLTPATARGIAQRTGGTRFREGDLVDPELNIRYGSWYLRNLHRTYDTRPDRYVISLAAYNAGQGRVAKWIEDDEDGQLRVDEIPFEETRQYVRRVQQLEEIYERAYPELSGDGVVRTSSRPLRRV